MESGIPWERKKWLSLLLVAAPVLYSVASLVWVLSVDPRIRVQFIPDDAFYYLTLARNFAQHGEWSFDAGVSQTTGFHLLHAYFLSGLFALFNPSAEGFVRLSMASTWLIGFAALAIGGAAAYRTRRLTPPLLFALFVLSRNVSLDAISIVEWPWVAAVTAVLYWLHSRPGPDDTLRTIGFFALCGTLGALARSDFGLLPAALVLAALLAPVSGTKRRQIVRTVSTLAGAVVGTAAVTAHNYLVSGSFVQSSAQMKYFWMSFHGPSPRPILRTILTLFGEPAILTLVIALPICLLLIVAGLQHFSRRTGGRDSGPVSDADFVLWWGSILALAGYIVFYAFNSVGVQHWYTAILVVPLFTVGFIPLRRAGVRRPVRISIGILLTIALAFQVRQAWRFHSSPEWPHQRHLHEAGEYIGSAGGGGRYGSWNAGVLGYYSNGRVINLDGLVNNSIYAYAIRNELPEYIDSVSIEYLVDYSNMFEGEAVVLRGGYARPDFLARMQPMRRFGADTSGWIGLTLYRLAPPEENPDSGR